MFVDDKWIFVGPMAAAAILHHSKPARIDLVGHALIEHDHAVRDIFLSPYRVSEFSPRSPVTIAVTPKDFRPENLAPQDFTQLLVVPSVTRFA